MKAVTATQLQAHACKATLDAAGVRPDQVDSVVIGNVLVTSQSDGIYIPRHTSLLCGVPIDRPALGVNRLCGSGFQSIVNGAQDIILGAAKISLTGGVDSMSLAPFVVRNVRFGTALGAPNAFEDSLWVIGILNKFFNLFPLLFLFYLNQILSIYETLSLLK